MCSSKIVDFRVFDQTFFRLDPGHFGYLLRPQFQPSLVSFIKLQYLPVFTSFLNDVIIKLFCFDLQNISMFTSFKKWEKQVKTQKSTNNLMSSFGLLILIFGPNIYLIVYSSVWKLDKQCYHIY